MIRFSHLIHGSETVSRVMVQRNLPSGSIPANFLVYSGDRHPVIFWNVTSGCNLSCSHCYARAGPHRDGPGRELDTVEALSLVDDLAASGVPLLIVSGGEPLVRKDIWEILARARDRGIRLALSTNGTLIDGAVARRLRDTGVEYAGISLDGAEPGTHERLRGVPGCFDDALTGLAHCRRAGMKTGVRFTATLGNAGELGALIALSLDRGVDRFCVYWLVPSGRGQDNYSRNRLDTCGAARILDTIYAAASGTNPDRMEYLTVDAPQDMIYLMDRLQREDPRQHKIASRHLVTRGAGCSAGDRVACISPEGNVYPCQFAQLPEFLIGSVRERSFGELWNDPAHPVLQAFRNKPVRLKGRCGDCRHRAMCGGGCRVRAYHASGDICGEDPFCIVQP